MQIRKGPFGYYACEKFDSPDRICTYAEEVISGDRSDLYLPVSTEYFGSTVMCSFEFSGYIGVNDPGFSVFPPNGKFASHKKENIDLNLRRKSVGDLFYSVIKLLDNLVSPSCLVLDPSMVFTDPEGISIKMCCLPLKSSPDDLCLSSLGVTRLERLLNCDFFKKVITGDEINALLFSVKENNEDMFLKIAGIIRGTDDELSPLNNNETAGTGTEHAPKKYTKTEKDLFISCISAFLSAISIIRSAYLPCLLFFILSLIILLTSCLNRKKLEEKQRKEENREISRQRSSILFSDDEGTIQIPDQGISEEPSAKKYKPVLSGHLNLISDSSGVNRQYSVYLDETCIGSDCFLSDIVLDDPEISPLHAVIRHENGSFYLMPSKGNGKTYIEDSPVENGRSYEIKSGQKITIGSIEFRFGTT
ncbi:MAG: FHA domain-containing protein [Clostridiales bacterium]|nr:FHA domain-containing protein [Clostridiales bacterium]